MAENDNSIDVCATLSTDFTLEKGIFITLETDDGTGTSHNTEKTRFIVTLSLLVTVEKRPFAFGVTC